MSHDDDDDWLNIGGSPPAVSLKVRNNADWTQPFQLGDYNAATNTRQPHNLTLAALRMQLKPQPGAAVVLDISTTNNKVVVDVDPTTGVFTIDVPAAEMWGAFAAGVYVGDMLVFNQDGTIQTAFTLRLEVDGGETEPEPPT